MKARIYKISNTKDPTYYIGVTKHTLEERFELHKNKDSCPRTSKFYKHYDLLGWEYARIELLEEVDVENVSNMLIYETRHMLKYIKDPNLLNSHISFDFHHLFLKKKYFMKLPVHLIEEMNKLHKECERMKETQCNKPSIFRRARYEKVEKLQEYIVKQYEVRKKGMEEMLGNFEGLSE